MAWQRYAAFLRPSFWRMVVSQRNLTTTGQIGDGREAAAVDYVLTNAAPGDVDGAVGALDTFAYEKSFLVNIGDEKGRLLDAAVRRAAPTLALELGTYCGYGALRIALAAPSAHIVSVELAAANAQNARRIWAHAGVADRVSCVVGTIGDGGRTLDALSRHGLSAATLDFLFLDHDKDAYLSDLHRIVERRWLRRGAIVVADNVLLPGAPDYRAFMRAHDGHSWTTVEHKTHGEYGALLPDVVLESEYLGPH